MNERLRHRLLKAVRITLNILTACLLACAVICSYLEHALFNVEAYQSSVLTEEFDAYVSREITTSLESIGTIVEIPSEAIIEGIGMHRMITYAHDYTNAFLEQTINGKEILFEDFSSDALRDVVSRELARYAEAEGLTITPENEEEVSAYILERINLTLHYIPARILTETDKLSRKLDGVRAIRGLEVPLYGGALLFLLVNLLLAGRRHAKKMLSGTVYTLWCAFATVFFPLLALSIYNIPSRIALTESTLYCLLTGVCRMLITHPTELFGLILLVLTAILVCVCLRRARKLAKQDAKRPGFFRVNFSEENASHHHKSHQKDAQEQKDAEN